jgi:uncharacterized membrane protein
MTFDQFLRLSPVILLHALCALLAFFLGSYQLLAKKGTASHRLLGYLWCALMETVAIASFWIHSINQFMGFSFIHLISVYVAVSLPVAVNAARYGNIQKHRNIMTGTYFGGLILAGLLTLTPGRALGKLLFGW